MAKESLWTRIFRGNVDGQTTRLTRSVDAFNQVLIRKMKSVWERRDRTGLWLQFLGLYSQPLKRTVQSLRSGPR